MTYNVFSWTLHPTQSITFIHKWNVPSCLYSPAAEHHRTLAITRFPLVSDVAIFVLKRDVKLQLTN